MEGILLSAAEADHITHKKHSLLPIPMQAQVGNSSSMRQTLGGPSLLCRSASVAARIQPNISSFDHSFLSCRAPAVTHVRRRALHVTAAVVVGRLHGLNTFSWLKAGAM